MVGGHLRCLLGLGRLRFRCVDVQGSGESSLGIYRREDKAASVWEFAVVLFVRFFHLGQGVKYALEVLGCYMKTRALAAP